MKNFYFIFVFALSILWSCKTEIDSGTIVDIEKEFELQLTETLDSSLSGFQLLVTSTRQQACSNVRIDYAVSSFSNRIIVTIKSLKHPTLCNGLLDVAHDTIPLGQLTEGSYRIQINLKDAVINQGTLTVTASRAIIEMNTNNGINITDPILWRLPERAIWGGIAADANVTLAMHKVLDTISTICPIFSGTLNNYGHFNIQPSNLISIQGFQSNLPNVVRFVRTLPLGKEAELKRVLQNFRNHSGNSGKVEVWSRYGNKY